jgi:hypothetical protein
MLANNNNLSRIFYFSFFLEKKKTTREGRDWGLLLLGLLCLLLTWRRSHRQGIDHDRYGTTACTCLLPIGDNRGERRFE